MRALLIVIAVISFLASLFTAGAASGATLPLILAALFGLSATVAVGALAIIDAIEKGTPKT